MYFTVYSIKRKRIHIIDKLPVKNKKTPTSEKKINLIGPNSHLGEAHFWLLFFSLFVLIRQVDRGR